MRYKFTFLFILSVFALRISGQTSTCAGPITYTVSPLPGPGNTYAPGEVVTFCITVNGYNQNISNWLHGLTLNFGPGWDVNSLTVISYPTPANPGGSSPDSPNVWGYFPQGVTSAASGNYFGAGFYFETGESSGANGGVWDGNPGDNYGDDCISGNCVWTFCFSIQVSPAATAGTSISLSVLPSGDGESGDWPGGLNDCNDPPTTISTAVVGGNVLVVSDIGTNISCFGLCNGTATALAFNGTRPYTYKWSTAPLQTDSTASSLCAGTYTCTVTDAASNTATGSYTVTGPTQLVLADSLVNPTCNGLCNGAVITQVTGGTPPYSYAWIGGAAPNSAVDYSICAGLVKLTVTDSNHCTLVDSFTLTQGAASAVNLVSQTNILCRGESTGVIDVSYSGGSGSSGVIYAWSNAESGAADTALPAGIYTVTATDTGGCSATATYTITQPANGINLQNPVITNSACTGVADGSIDASATGGSGNLTYTWTEVSNSAQLSGADISNLEADTYDLTVTDANGCSVSASYQVTAPAAVVIDSVTGVNERCFNGVTASATVYSHGGANPLHYLWSAATTDTLETVTGLMAGTVYVTVADAHQCKAIDSIIITQPTALVITTTDQTNLLCYGGDTGSITISASGGTPNYTYAWSNGGQAPANTGLTAGVYTLTLTDANQCTVTATYTLTQPNSALSSSAVVQNILCFGAANGQIAANPVGGTPPYAYKWSNSDSGQTATSLAPGSYNGTVTDVNGCSVAFAESVTQPPQLNIAFTASPVKCIGQKNGSVTFNLSGGTPPYGYSATKDSVNFIYGEDNSITGLDTGTYILLFSDSNGCTNESSVYIPNATPDSFNIAVDSTSCYGPNYTDGSILVTAVSVQNGPYTYAIDNGLQQDTGYFAGLASGTHSIVCTSANNCLDTVSATVYQPAQIIASIEPDSITIVLGSSKSVVVSYLNANNPIFNWTPNLGLSCADCSNPVVSPYTNTIYTVTVSQPSSNPGVTCSATASLDVTVTPFTPVFVPNAFSPNGDGNDDVFKVYGDNISAVSMKIFNRWGELVFESTNSLQGWDGRYKGVIQEPNVYVYDIIVTFLDYSQSEKIGSVTLLR